MRDNLLLRIWWLLLAAAAVVLRLSSEGIIDSGDGIQHYHIARGSWHHPMLLLDHWGKPLFTLAASPFAQLGLWGMTLFNALCFLLTCWAADGIIRSHGPSLRWLFAPLLLLVPEYGRMVLAGMTEPFFGLLTLFVLRTLHDRRFRTAALIASFMPFARPEYIAFLPFVAAWLILQKNWRPLPLLLVGHAVYGLIGWLALGDPLWHFHRDPYTGAESVYGQGEYWHFVQRMPQSLGWPLLLLALASLIGAVSLRWRGRTNDSAVSLLVVASLLPAAAIILVHSVLWAQGLKGSLGLTRVMATAAPLLGVFAIAPMSALLRLIKGSWRMRVACPIGIAAIGFSVSGFLAQTPLPYPMDGYQRFLRMVGEQAKAVAQGDARVVFFHPMIAFHAGLDPYDSEHARQCWGLDTSAYALGLAENEVLAWDAHFGPNEGGAPIAMLLDRDDLEVVDVMVPDERMVVLGDQPMEAWFFKTGQQSRAHSVVEIFDQQASPVQWRADSVPCPVPMSGICLNSGEFPLELLLDPLNDPNALYRELRVTVDLAIGVCASRSAELVYTETIEDRSLMYYAWPATSGRLDIRCRIPRRSPEASAKLYLWNLNACAITIDSLRVFATDTRRMPAITPP
jgi:hypothetical protein